MMRIGVKPPTRGPNSGARPMRHRKAGALDFGDATS
jgi:hypothetical protein